MEDYLNDPLPGGLDLLTAGQIADEDVFMFGDDSDEGKVKGLLRSEMAILTSECFKDFLDLDPSNGDLMLSSDAILGLNLELLANEVTVSDESFESLTLSVDENGDLMPTPLGDDELAGKEDAENKVIAWQEAPDHTHYPSEKLVKDTIDGLSAKAIKDPCRVATTANITLSGTKIIDGAAVVAGERVLARAQNAGAENGIYVVAAGAWTRAIDMATSAQVRGGMFVAVSEGTLFANSVFMLTTNDAIVLGTTPLEFSLPMGLVYSANHEGTADAISVTLFPAPTAWSDLAGKIIVVKIAANNTGPVTFAVAGLSGTKSVKKQVSEALAANDLLAGGEYLFFYDGINIQVMGLSPVVQVYHADDTGSANAISISLAPAPASWTDLIGKIIAVKIEASNTGATTVAVAGLSGTKSVKKQVSEALAANDLLAGGEYLFVYDDTNFQMQAYEPVITKSTGYVKWSGSAWEFKNETYVTGTPWTSMGYVTGTPWTACGYITSAALSDYATLLYVQGLHLSDFDDDVGYVTGTPWTACGYITSAALSDYATLLYVQGLHLSDFDDDVGYVTGTPWTACGYITSAALSDYATLLYVQGLHLSDFDDDVGYVTGTPWTACGYITSAALSDYATLLYVQGLHLSDFDDDVGYVTGTPWTACGYITSAALSDYATLLYVQGLHLSDFDDDVGYVTGTPWTACGYLTASDGKTGWDAASTWVSSYGATVLSTIAAIIERLNGHDTDISSIQDWIDAHG